MIGMHNRSVARNAASVFVLVTSLLAFAHSADAQTKHERIVDTKFDVSVAKPAYKDKHPAVLFDNAHFNYHTSDGLYTPLVDLIANDGYRVTPNKQPLSAKGLDGFDILLIANARSAQDQTPTSTDPAFTKEECDAVYDWVRGGGSLLLIADHAPFGAAAEMLAVRFGVDMGKGWAVDDVYYEKSGNKGWLVFTRENNLLGDHPITNGRGETERIKRIITFAGQSLKGPEGSAVLFKLSDTAKDQTRPGSPEPVSAKGRAQAVAFKSGKGRVVVLGEAAMMSAGIVLEDGKEKYKVGMNFPGVDNRQFALNVMHWLSGLTK
jgi:hypothetical protein